MSYVIETKNLYLKLNEFLLSNIEIRLERGKVLGIIGPNASGKSTIINLLCGLIKPDKGEIYFLNKLYNEGNINLEGKIGVVKDVLLFPEYNKITQIIRFISNIYHDFDLKYFYELIELLNIDISKKVSELSKGTKLKLNLAIILSRYVELLLLDEPFSGLDPTSQINIIGLLKKNKMNSQSSIITLHNLYGLEGLLDEIYFIFDGKITFKENLHKAKTRFHLIIFTSVIKIKEPQFVLISFSEFEKHHWITKIEDIDSVKIYLSAFNIGQYETKEISREEIFNLKVTSNESIS
jgi:ABC-2 type transport system ATP-binding protein